MTDKPLQLAMVGAGAISQTYAQALLPMGSVRVVTVADTRAEAADALASILSCETSTDASTLGPGLDAVVLATPPDTHEDLAVHFLRQGVAVLCEKPLAPSPAAARRMVAASASSGAPLVMASKFRFVDDVSRARSIIASGALGEIALLENVFSARVPMAGRWNADPARAGGGVLIDNGTHSVDIVRFLLGPIVEVLAVAGPQVQPLEVEDTARLFLNTESGAQASVELSWSLARDLDHYLEIHGSEGSLRVGWGSSRWRRTGSVDWQPFGTGYDKFAAVRRQVDNFCAHVRGFEPSLITAPEALASVDVIAAAYQALAGTTWVPVRAPAAAAA